MSPQPEIDSLPISNRSTGPTTQAGKDRSKLNALRHGLSGQTVLMPWEDREAYQTHCASFLKTLAPVGDIETQASQGIADDQWRLNRARAVDTNMFALGHFDYPAETGHPQIDAALITARVFRDNSKVFVNLSLYEQRINRSLEKNFDRLQTLQATRHLQEREALVLKIRENRARPAAAAAVANGAAAEKPIAHQPPSQTPSPGQQQFVCSSSPNLPCTQPHALFAEEKAA